MQGIGLSTMWVAERFNNIADFVDEVRQYGFDHIQLNYNLTPQMARELPGISALKVSSILLN